MVREALTGYWSLISGLTEVTVERARAAAKALVAQGDATRDQVSGLAQEIAETSRANRTALVNLVRYEAERAAGRLGFAGADEVSTLQGRVRELERSVAELRAAADASAGGTGGPGEAAVPGAAPAEVAGGPDGTGPGEVTAARGGKAPGRKATEKAPAAKAAKAADKAPGRKATAKASKATKAAGTRATPRKRTVEAAGVEGPGSAS
jgi:polyhydroxyalkanoate synthesis regulator phasin